MTFEQRSLDDYAPDCQGRRCDDCTAGDCVCACHTADPDLPSPKPGSITGPQRDVLIGLLMEQGFIGDGKWKARAIMLAEVIPGWPWHSDIGALSQAQAEDLIAELRQRKEQAGGQDR
jgi:hypothetical protein